MKIKVKENGQVKTVEANVERFYCKRRVAIRMRTYINGFEFVSVAGNMFVKVK